MDLQMKSGVLALGVGLLAACRLGSSPIFQDAQPTPGPATSQLEASPDIYSPSDGTSSVIPPSPASTPARPVLNPLPVCSQSSSTEFAELTLGVAADWDGDDEIYLIQADGSNLVQLTFNNSGDIEPVWSPDGSQLAYVANADTEPRVWVYAPDDAEGRIVAPDIEARPGHAAIVWSPSENKLAFKNMEGLFVVDLDGNQTLNLVRGADLAPREVAFSRDGRMLAFTASGASQSDSGSFSLRIVNVDGTGLKELRFPVEPVFWPDWHPQEDKILFEGIVPDVSVGLYVATPDGALEQLPIQRGSISDIRAAWSPDGRMVGYIFAFVGVDSQGHRVSRNTLHVATADGTVDLELVRPPSNPDARLHLVGLAWAGDSRHIAYTTMKGSGSAVEQGADLFVLDICDGRSSLVVEGIDYYSAPSWKPLP